MEAKQGQRFIVLGDKGYAVEQVQTVQVVSPKDLRGCLEQAYHICKADGRPVLPTVAREMAGIARGDCTSNEQCAEVLGVGYRKARSIMQGKDVPVHRTAYGLLNE